MSVYFTFPLYSDDVFIDDVFIDNQWDDELDLYPWYIDFLNGLTVSIDDYSYPLVGLSSKKFMCREMKRFSLDTTRRIGW